MHGKSFFLDRVISRSRDWQGRFPALASSSHEPASISGGRQIVVAVTDREGIRCGFFSNHGSVLDFSATWSELEAANTWWHFARRWNFWICSSGQDLRAIRGNNEETLNGLVIDGDTVDRRDSTQFLGFLARVELGARRHVHVVQADSLAEAL
jgi:hypothetical protein